MVEISVVVPVYYFDDFLEKCLDNIVNQTFKNIEIICVNYNSLDKSLDILNDYATIDNRFIVINQENNDQITTTNQVIDIAKGKYLFLMDSNKILDLNAFENTYKVAKEKNVDFVIFQDTAYYMDKNELVDAENYNINELETFVKDSVFNWKDIKDCIFNIATTPGIKLYNREFLVRHNINFPIKLFIDDDVFFFDALFAADKITLHKEHLFQNQYSSPSTTLKGTMLMYHIPICGLIWDIFTKYGVFKEFKEKLFEKKVEFINQIYTDIKEEFKQEFFNRIKADYVQLSNDDKFYVYFLNNLTKKQKMIFDSVLESELYQEFDLKLEHEKLLYKNYELKSELFQEIYKNKKIRKRYCQCNKEIKNLEYEIENLLIENEQLRDKINYQK